TWLNPRPYSKEIPGVQPDPSPAPTPPPADAYQVDHPVTPPPPAPPAAPVEEQKKEPEPVSARGANVTPLATPPLPPAFPLWSGVYTFPWRLDNLRVWITLALPMGAFVYLAAAFYLLASVVHVLDRVGFNPTAAFVVLLIAPMAIARSLGSPYASAYFLAIVEGAAGGSDASQQAG